MILQNLIEGKYSHKHLDLKLQSKIQRHSDQKRSKLRLEDRLRDNKIVLPTTVQRFKITENSNNSQESLIHPKVE